ncbi:MAG TPA: RNA polymerase sigma factor RpoH [Acetobacteraceae bacterium]|nr:RNA polymerase sigma factor RpoH [Acetobacteraceae bacterium]
MATLNAVSVASGSGGLRRYLQQIQKFPMLQADEELDLSRRWRRHEDIEAAHRLVTSHLRLVAKMAHGYRGYGLAVNDLISEGNIGMMQAVKRFDPETGFRLATYAKWWIRSAIRAYILQSWSLVKVGTTASQKRLFFNLRRMESRMQILSDGDLDRMQVSKIADMLRVPERTVISMHRRLAGPDHSLNAPVHPGNKGDWEGSLIDNAEDQETTIGEREEMAVRKAMLPIALGTLDNRQRHILIERRLKERPTTLDELARHYQVSAERVRQIEVRAFQKLRKSMREQAAA